MTVNFQPGHHDQRSFPNRKRAPDHTWKLNEWRVDLHGDLWFHRDSLSTQGLMFHRDAFTMACADLPLWKGTDMAQRAADKDLGLSIRLIPRLRHQHGQSTDQT